MVAHQPLELSVWVQIPVGLPREKEGEMERQVFQVCTTIPGHCGDNICLLSAAIEFAEKMDAIVYVNFFKDVIEAYNHPLLKFGRGGVILNTYAPIRHRNKHPGLFVNILGTYYAELGLPIGDPILRLPSFEFCPSRVLIQPFSKFATNPDFGYVQKIVDEFTEATGKQVFAIGGNGTPRNLENVDYTLLRDDVPFLMRQIQHATCVLTPRSLAANLAAGYGTPAFMWSPKDGEDWHLNYSTWKGSKVNFGQTPDPTWEELHRFIGNFGLGG